MRRAFLLVVALGIAGVPTIGSAAAAGAALLDRDCGVETPAGLAVRATGSRCPKMKLDTSCLSELPMPFLSQGLI